MKVFRIFFMSFLLLSLVACQREYTYAYLMQHPNVLKRAVAVCEANGTMTSAQSKQCEVTLYAAAQFTSLLNEAETDPEAFGERVLRAQMLYAQSSATNTNLAEQKQEIANMLAVIGVNSPE